MYFLIDATIKTCVGKVCKVNRPVGELQAIAGVERFPFRSVAILLISLNRWASVLVCATMLCGSGDL